MQEPVIRRERVPERSLPFNWEELFWSMLPKRTRINLGVYSPPPHLIDVPSPRKGRKRSSLILKGARRMPFPRRRRALDLSSEEDRSTL